MAKLKKTLPKRGQAYLVNFDPTLGAEIQKTRPALILQNDIANAHSPITIIASITSKFEEPLYPTEVLLVPPEGGLTVKSVVLLNQLRSIDRQRLIKPLGTISATKMKAVEEALQISLGLIQLAP
jgi:mRNA interferase MazF